MKYVYFLFLCIYLTLTAFSCDEGYFMVDASTKFHIYGQVVDNAGMPLKGIEVTVVEYAGNSLLDSSNLLQAPHLILQCMLTDDQGRYDFIVSDASSHISALEVNRSSPGLSFRTCFEDFTDDLQYKAVLYNDDNYTDYELNIDVELQPSIQVTVVNNIDYDNRRQVMDFHIEHEGNQHPDIRVWEYLRERDSLMLNIAPNQSIVLRTLENSDSLIMVSDENLTINLHN